MQPELQTQAKGRWADILGKLGVSREYLSKKQGPCPACGGKDRYRFDDLEGKGTFYCNHCGAGDGATLLMNVHGWDFAETAERVREILGECRVRQAEPKHVTTPNHLLARWKSGRPVQWGDPVADYLEARGYGPPYSDQLRYVEKCPYTDLATGKIAGELPAMIARFCNPQGKGVRLHRYFLSDGTLADIPKPKRMSGGGDMDGGAIRLSHFTDELGVAEGIETAMGAERFFNVPVWATATADLMAKFVWPTGLKRLWIFGDPDASFKGQASAYILANRAKTHKDGPEEVRVEFPGLIGMDWDDVHREHQAKQAA